MFETLFTEVLDDHAPLKQFHVRGNQVPYMTEEWRKTIRYRNRLWRKFTVNVTKNQRNRGHSSKFNFAHTLSIGRPKSHTYDKDVREA